MYICHQCGNASKDNVLECKYCKAPMHAELIEKRVVENYSDFSSYIYETYIKGHPDRELNVKKRNSRSHQEFIDGIKKHNMEVEARNTLHCPRCGSTAVVVGTRGYSMMTGFIGSGDTMNRCGNCGHKWKPRG